MYETRRRRLHVGERDVYVEGRCVCRTVMYKERGEGEMMSTREMVVQRSV